MYNREARAATKTADAMAPSTAMEATREPKAAGSAAFGDSMTMVAESRKGTVTTRQRSWRVARKLERSPYSRAKTTTVGADGSMP